MVGENEIRRHFDEQKHGVTTEIVKTTEFTTDGFLPKVCKLVEDDEKRQKLNSISSFP
jgi:hypothetical protein